MLLSNKKNLELNHTIGMYYVSIKTHCFCLYFYLNDMLVACCLCI